MIQFLGVDREEITEDDLDVDTTQTITVQSRHRGDVSGEVTLGKGLPWGKLHSLRFTISLHLRSCSWTLKLSICKKSETMKRLSYGGTRFVTKSEYWNNHHLSYRISSPPLTHSVPLLHTHLNPIMTVTRQSCYFSFHC